MSAFCYILMKMLRKLTAFFRRFTKKHGYTCDLCGAELFDYPIRRVCEPCKRAIYGEKQPTCPKCGRQTVATGVCLTCKSRVPAFYKGFAPFCYEGDTAGQVNRLKNGNRRLAFFFAEEMSDCFLKATVKGEDKLLIIPVPLTKEKRKIRGYNQAEDLAEHIYTLFIKAGLDCELDSETLIKTRDTENQKSLGFFDRLDNVSGVYRVKKRKFCRGKKVLLVDDIMTTGATGSACAQKLLSAGAERVYLLVTAAVPERIK